ncbi:MAG: RdgB/HAM1 family non-canonical purine NTP pyrophosphatase [Bacteroidia bacterium]|nr:RdgB/HAM1 family non-canonical purine NTP pyrophosphatase [Bacteroidia bacterium]
MITKLLFGTNNLHKLEEIQAIVGNTYTVSSLRDLGIDMDVEETEDTLHGNAELKAKAYFKVSGVPTFADDTGLEVAALDGRPGVYSARYAGEHASYSDNVEKLLQEMEGKENRDACFRTVIAFYDGEQTRFFEGEIKGKITIEPRGQAGFGYDPVFQPEESEETFAEMPPEYKNDISHRGRAIRKFAHYLMQLSS